MNILFHRANRCAVDDQWLTSFQCECGVVFIFETSTKFSKLNSV